MKKFGGMGDASFVDTIVAKSFAKNDVDGSGKLDVKEAYIALLGIYRTFNKLAPFDLPPPKFAEMKMYCKKADVNSDVQLSQEEFKAVCKMVIGGDTSTVTRSLWFRILWHSLLELVLYAATAEVICNALGNPPWLKASVLVVLLKVTYKILSMVANKKLLDNE